MFFLIFPFSFRKDWLAKIIDSRTPGAGVPEELGCQRCAPLSKLYAQRLPHLARAYTYPLPPEES